MTRGSADAATAGAPDVPVGRIVGVGAPVAWDLTVVAVVVALVVSLYPLLATADAALQQGRAFVPWVTGLVAQLRG